MKFWAGTQQTKEFTVVVVIVSRCFPMLLQFSLRLSQDGSGRGAAIVASVAHRMTNWPLLLLVFTTLKVSQGFQFCWFFVCIPLFVNHVSLKTKLVFPVMWKIQYKGMQATDFPMFLWKNGCFLHGTLVVNFGEKMLAWLTNGSVDACCQFCFIRDGSLFTVSVVCLASDQKAQPTDHFLVFQIKLMLSEDGSGKGAALVAAVSYRVLSGGK